MAALLDSSPTGLFLFVTNIVLDGTALICTIVLLIVYAVHHAGRTQAGNSVSGRASDENMKLFTIVALGLLIGSVSFWGTGMFTDRPLLGGLGNLCFEGDVVYLFVMALRWVRYF